MWSKLAAALVVAACAAMIASCGSSGCLENRNSVPLAGFYDSHTGQQLRLDSVEISGMGMSEPLVKAGQKISSVYLPMRSTQPSTTWLLAYKWRDLDFAELVDTLQFDYDSEPYFADIECGVIYKYHITRMRYTCHLIDSIVLADSVITNLDVEQIKIYFRTNNDPGDESTQQ